MGQIEDLIKRGDALFGQRGTLTSYWQGVAENFYPERADFTVIRTLGDSFTENLYSSYPLLVRRDLGNTLGTMQRPKATKWFHMGVARDDHLDQAGREWLEEKTDVMRRAMYDRRSLFAKASKEADMDISSFGQAVKSIEESADRSRMLYRCWHLRDCAWIENSEGQIDTMHRKWKPTARELLQLFPGKCHSKVVKCVEGQNKEPEKKINVRHVVIPREDYNEDYPGKHLKFMSCFIDVDNKHMIEITGKPYFCYVVPRWQTVSGSQYAYSPATVIALPDARLLQATTQTLLEAGEKYVSPPMIGVEEAIRGDLAIYAGAVTWVDSAYDERLGEVLRPLSQDKSGMPIGMELADRTSAVLREAFFLNTLTMPPASSAPDMTAYEVGQRVQEYIRQASPIFEPLEDEDNAATCERTFEVMMLNGAFGSREDIPESVRGQEVSFRFESPLHDAVERQKGQKFMEASGLIAQAMPLEPTVKSHLDVTTAFRDALMSVGVPPKWMNSEQEAQELIEQEQQAMQQQALVEQVAQGAEAAKLAGEAGQALAG